VVEVRYLSLVALSGAFEATADFLREAERLELNSASLPPHKYLLRTYSTSIFTYSEAFSLVTRRLDLCKEHSEVLVRITRRRKERQAYR
jgi:hypothetical protein